MSAEKQPSFHLSSQPIKEELILPFIPNIQNRHIWRCVVFAGQEGYEILSSENN